MNGDYERRACGRILLPALPGAGERPLGVRGLRFPDLPALRNSARTGRRFGNRLKGTLVLLGCILFLSGCQSAEQQETGSTVGVAYVGPSTLRLRKDLGARSGTAATAKHGDRLDVIEIRRRFAKVRTADGAVGWTMVSQLLSEPQVDDLKKLAESAKKLPSEGSAMVYDSLNVHAEPYRQSPSFYQIPENGKIDVLAHRVSLRHRPPDPPPPRRAPHESKTKPKRAGVPLLPLAGPPPPPRNWVELSRPRLVDLPGYAPSPPSAPPPEDDWYLVRLQNGEVGWVLARRVSMAIPDEVAQYADGDFITSYLPLGEVQDQEKNETKRNWLWTTASEGKVPYEFDSFRVFVWSLSRHRYETAYIERHVKGYYPVEAVSLPGREDKAFSLVMEGGDGELYKYTYAFSGYRVEKVSKVPYRRPPPLPEVRPLNGFEEAGAEASGGSSGPGWGTRARSWTRKWRRKLGRLL